VLLEMNDRYNAPPYLEPSVEHLEQVPLYESGVGVEGLTDFKIFQSECIQVHILIGKQSGVFQNAFGALLMMNRNEGIP